MEEVKYKQADHVLGSKLDEAMIITSTENDKFYGMNKIASIIWEIVEEPTSKNEIIENLLSRFDVEKDQCEKELNLFFNEMKKAGIITEIK